jgi:hypothetical protein
LVYQINRPVRASRGDIVRTYTLLLDRKPPSPPLRIDFRADDPARAVQIAQRESANRPFEVWEGERRLGKLTPMDGEFWQID